MIDVTCTNTGLNEYKKPIDRNDFFLTSDKLSFDNIKKHDLCVRINTNPIVKVIEERDLDQNSNLIELKGASKFLD